MSKLLRVGFLGALLALGMGGLLPDQSAGMARAAEPYRLGFSGRDLPGQGVQILSVTPGGPATNLYRPGNAANAITLTPGDVITAVNGMPVRSLADYFRAMSTVTPGKVRIMVRDASNGQLIELATPAALGGGGKVGIQFVPQQAGGAARIYILKVTDTNAKGQDGKKIAGLRVDQGRVLSLFRENIPEDRRRVISLADDEVSKENVLAEIRNLGANGFVAGRDTLVIYYNGHGEYNLRAADHVMNTSGGKIYFDTDIGLAVNEVHPRSTLIISDACAAEVMGQEFAQGAAPEESKGPEKLPPLFESLFLDPPPGITEISSTMKGQYAVCESVSGSYFSSTLCDVIQSHLNQRMQWKDILDEVNSSIRQYHAKNTHQVAYIVGNNGGADPPPRFGVVAQATELGQQFHGVEVTVAMAGYPCQSMHLRGDDKKYALNVNRDVIQKMNGEPVADYAEFINACRNSPTKMTVTVYDTQTGQTNEFEVDLRNDR